jgi:hypothetical protein
MNETAQPTTHRQGRYWLRKKLPELQRLMEEFRAFEASLNFPSPAELAEMESGRRRVTREAYLGAVTHRIAFYIEEAWSDAEVYLEESPDALVRRGMPCDLFKSFGFAVRFRANPKPVFPIAEPDEMDEDTGNAATAPRKPA